MKKNNIVSSSALLVSLIIITLLSFLPGAHAYRPLSTEDAGVGAMGEIVVEAAYENVKEEDETEHAGVFAFVFGLEKAEVALESGYIKTPYDKQGPCDLLFFAKYLLWGADEKSGMFTIKAETLSTTGDEEKGLGGENWEYAGSTVYSKTLGIFNVHAQLGYNYVNDSKTDSNSYFYGLAFDYGLAESLLLVAEITGSYNDDENFSAVHAGLVYELNEMAAIDAAGCRGLLDRAGDWIYTAGVTLTF